MSKPETQATKTGVDNRTTSMRECEPTGVAERTPPRATQEMINLRRQLKQFLAYADTFLRKAGVRID